LNALNQIARQLADIHNQFEFAKLLNPDNYLDLVDGFSFDKVAGYKSDYAQKLESYQKTKQRYEELLAQKAKVEASKDFYQFQLKELDEANLQENEEADIASEIALLGNYDRVYSLMEEADSIAHEDFIDRLYELSKALGKLAAYQSQYKVTQEQVEEHYYSLQDTLSQLKKDFRNLDYDPERLNQLQQRSSDIAALKRKYRKSVPELLAYQRELRSLVGEGSDLEGDIQAKKEETEQFHHQAYESGMALRALRKTLARTMENEVRHNLEDLLLSCDFRIDFGADPSEEGVTFLSSGIDSIDFLIETNVGEGLKSLSKVVSGGEASRIMLAFKAVFVKANRVSTVIFDEIDTGLSGEAAQAVASKIKDISLSTQVIAITHMPQVAALSDHHVLVEKSVMLGRTSTSIKELSLEEKIHEVAYLISGGKVTKKQLEYAKEIILGGR
nr:hypothetical protein [Bacilli bacterium]